MFNMCVLVLKLNFKRETHRKREFDVSLRYIHIYVQCNVSGERGVGAGPVDNVMV